MKIVKPAAGCGPFENLLETLDEEISQADQDRFFQVVSTDLADWQVEQVVGPETVHRRQDVVLATHWHPEFVPMPLIERRIAAMFPNMRESLCIPTQHNELTSYGPYSGVEVDCYSHGFNRKVQLLLHFRTERLGEAHTLRSILAHTYKYRSSQLFEFLRALTSPEGDSLNIAARETGADAGLIAFVRVNAAKIEKLLDMHWDKVPGMSLKNKLLRNWFDAMRPHMGEVAAERAQAFLGAVKRRVKAGFSLKYFYRASEVIEEARSLGGGVVIPHPEQFWPILLAGYDVDGIEVWNPQSLEYTEFLISVTGDKNRAARPGGRKLLVFMGDDCHMGEKTKPKDQQDAAKAGREIGVQPAWEDLSIRKKLIVEGVSRSAVIREYKERLAG